MKLTRIHLKWPAKGHYPILKLLAQLEQELDTKIASACPAPLEWYPQGPGARNDV